MGVALPVVSVTAEAPPLHREAHQPAPGPVVCSLASADRGLEWDAFVRSRADSSGYHLWRWRRVFEAGLGLRCHYVVATRHGTIAGVLPLVEVRSLLFGRALSSLPYVNYGGVVAEDGETASALVDHAAGLARARSLSYVLLRHRTRQMHGLPARSHKVTMLLPLAETRELMWNRLDRKVRNQVRKAEKSGVTVQSGGLDLLDDFYRVFARNMRDLGTPVYGKTLFASILREFPADAQLHVARVNGGAIAGALSYAYGEWIEVPSASSLREHRALCPNHLLYWSIMTAAIAAGRRVFDFGRSTPHDGTYHFKEQWGASPAQLWWEYRLRDGVQLPSTDRHSAKVQAQIEAWKRLPLAIATALGPHLARLVP
jgi:FemAB-related protein (PEP-CTERM system-associated)